MDKDLNAPLTEEQVAALSTEKKYAFVIFEHLAQLFIPDEDGDVKIDLKEVALKGETTQFFYALGAMIPTIIHNRMTKEKSNALQINHRLNELCFLFMEKKDTEGDENG